MPPPTRSGGPSELLRVFHDETRAPIRLGTAQRPIEVDGPVRREYDVDGGHWNMVESPDGLGPDPDAGTRHRAAARLLRRAGPAGRVEDLRLRRAAPTSASGSWLPASSSEDDEALILGEAAPARGAGHRLPEGVVVRAADC